MLSINSPQYGITEIACIQKYKNELDSQKNISLKPFKKFKSWGFKICNAQSVTIL